MTNPLLVSSALPAFSDCELAHFEPAINEIIERNKKLVDTLIENKDYSWAGLYYPIEQADDELENAWSVISHYNGVLNSDELRDIYKRLIGKLTEYQTERGQNKALYEAYLSLSESDEFASLDSTQRKAISNTLRDFRLAGVALNDADKDQFSSLKKELSELTTQFSENVLDATQGWTKLIDDAEELAGLPDSALGLLANFAKEHGHDSGYLITLDFPSYMPIMTYCENRSLREEVYTAFITRASDQGPNAGKWDNTDIIEQVLSKRKALAKLLSFDNYAERSVETKMAENVQEVVDFLYELADKSYPFALKEFDELRAFAKEHCGADELEVWDVAFYSEKQRQHCFKLTQEEVRPYFPTPVVIDGMFKIVNKLYGIDVKENPDVATYHADAKYYEVSQAGKLIAGFYLDPYARKNKKGGAWMADARMRRRLPDDSIQLPVAFLTCNFTPPVNGEPSLLTHNEVTTLFHEFGHGLHHMLTRVEVSDVSGINGVAWDVVELPSQFLESWCWHEESLAMISAHVETGEKLPEDLLAKMLDAKNFQAGMMTVRQLEFALFDILLHRDYVAGETEVLKVLDQVRDKVSVKKPPAFARFSHAFSHIFAGGYAAGYYSYKWAEVLAADAFSRFEEEGIFNAETGQSFKEEILEVGGSKDAMEMFVAFRGRKPSVEPLLEQSGIKA